jgi:hypothetical protein
VLGFGDTIAVIPVPNKDALDFLDSVATQGRSGTRQ